VSHPLCTLVSMRCDQCDHDLACCHSTSVEHADGATECLADEPCGLAHGLHRWVLPCTDVDPGCACSAAPVGALPVAA
jgi:hypothetical protein